jgi:molybdopterin-biosynthesis enzyme MoeA-like protein
MHPRDEKQALLPTRAAVLPNPLGVAPGFHLCHPKGGELFFLPGVPLEMHAMLVDSVVPRLLALDPRRPAQAVQHLTVFGLAEPRVERRLGRPPCRRINCLPWTSPGRVARPGGMPSLIDRGEVRRAGHWKKTWSPQQAGLTG